MKLQFATAVLVAILSAIPSVAWDAQFIDEGGIASTSNWLSDDGRVFAYVKDMDDNLYTAWDREVFYADFSSGTIHRITRDVEANRFAAVSPDGSKVAYIEGNVYDLSATKTVCLYDTASGNEQVVDTFTASDNSRLDSGLGFTRDGKVVLCLTWEDTGKRYCYLYDGSTLEPGGLTTDLFLVEMSERRVVLVNSENSYSVWTIGGGVYRFLSLEEGEIMRGVKPSNTGSIAIAIEGARGGIFLYRPGEELQPVVYNPCDSWDRFGDVAISKDGKRLFYSCVIPNSRFSVHMVDLESFEDQRIFEASANQNIDGHSVLSEFDDVEIAAVDQAGSRIVIFALDFVSVDASNGQLWLLSESSTAQVESGESGAENPQPFEGTTVVFKGASGSYGDEVQVAVEIKNAARIASMNLELGESSEILKPVGVLPGALTQDALFESNIVNERVRVGIVSTDGISGDGSILYVKFRVNQPEDGKGKGTSSGKPVSSGSILDRYRGKMIGLKIYSVYAKDLDGNVVEIRRVNGTFVLATSEEERVKGDINGDGVVDSADALIILKMSVGKVPVKTVADINGDGKVLSDDAFEVLKLSAKKMIK